ncbi:MAG: FlgD immunoglobulin-like domain containing protein [Acidobacteriota bacterium]|nr:FlgD immunoglobulin-like domain containing protein [Acidobacteriota bacterium]
MRTLIITGLVLLAANCLHAQMIDDFSGDVSVWKPEMQYGDVTGCEAGPGPGNGEGKSLQIDYVFADAGTNHIIYARPVELDLSWTRGLSFDLRGTGDPVSVFLFLWDADGHFVNYGPHGTNLDFHTGHAEWTTLSMAFRTDASIQGGGADLSRVRRIGFMLNQVGQRKGTVWIDNLRGTGDAEPWLSVGPGVISPNGDGVNDGATISIGVPRDSEMTVDILDAKGNLLAVLANAWPTEKHQVELTWNGKAQGKTAPDGDYTIRMRFSGDQERELSAPVAVNTEHRWPPISYQVEPFFPVGVWFEGSPAMAGYPDDPAGAHSYFLRCFKDMAAHGFNCAAVPNCPETLWEPLLQAADQAGIRIVLEVGPLVQLVSQNTPVSEAEVFDAVSAVVGKIGKYDSLLRYQIRDEPPRELIGNWILVQRALAAFDPKRPAFSCFCHPDSLARVSAETTLAEAVFDIYPHHKGTPLNTLGGFESGMRTFTQASGDNPRWVVLQAFAVPGDSHWRYPTPEELKAVTWLSLASGVRGVFYFIYQYMPTYLHGMVDYDGTPRPIYEPCAELASKLTKLSPLLMSLKPGRPVDAEGDAHVSGFRDATGKLVLIIASARPDREVAVTVKIGGPWVDAITGERLSPGNDGLTLTLPPGEGRVLVKP